jgi:hypothetical protein
MMSLLFSHPAVAWFLPAVALPILFHLFFRLRRQTLDFPSLLFFTRIDPKLSAKRKVHEWLILLLRCLFILLLVLALLRPRIETAGSGHIARLVLIDNSASMAAPAKDGAIKLVRAEQFAEKLIASSPKGDSVAVQLAVPDSTGALPRGFDADKSALRDALGKLTPTNGAANVPKAIRTALATLDNAKQPVHELHIVTDLQKNHWGRGELETLDAGRRCRIVVHRIDPPALTAGWVALELSQAPIRSLPTGRVTAVRVTLHNYSSATALVRLNSSDDSGKSFSRDISVSPGEAVPAALTFSFNNPGFHWARIWVEGDIAPAVDRIDLGFWCSEAQKTLFVGGREKFAALPFAIAPGGNADLSGIDAVGVNPDQLANELNAKPLAVALTWDDWPQDGAAAKALENYVRAGGTLFLVPAPDTVATVGKPLPGWIDASVDIPRQPKEAENLVPLQADDPVWRDLRSTDGKPNLGALRALIYRPLKLGKNWKPLLASAQGPQVLARQSVGKGTVYASGLAFTPKWSSLPLKAGFVALVQNAIFGERTESIPLVLHEAAGDIPFDQGGTQAEVRSLTGASVNWQGMPSDFPGLARAGVYEIRQKEKTKWIAIRSSAGEAAPDYISGRSIPLLKNAPHEVVALGETGTAAGNVSGRAHTPLYGPLLAAALIVLLLETWLANERGGSLGKKLFTSMLPSSLRRKTESSRHKRREALLR